MNIFNFTSMFRSQPRAINADDVCPITYESVSELTDPYQAQDGRIYSREALAAWLALNPSNPASPETTQPLWKDYHTLLGKHSPQSPLRPMPRSPRSAKEILVDTCSAYNRGQLKLIRTVVAPVLGQRTAQAVGSLAPRYRASATEGFQHGAMAVAAGAAVVMGNQAVQQYLHPQMGWLGGSIDRSQFSLVQNVGEASLFCSATVLAAALFAKGASEMLIHS